MGKYKKIIPKEIVKRVCEIAEEEYKIRREFGESPDSIMVNILMRQFNASKKYEIDVIDALRLQWVLKFATAEYSSSKNEESKEKDWVLMEDGSVTPYDSKMDEIAEEDKIVEIEDMDKILEEFYAMADEMELELGDWQELPDTEADVKLRERIIEKVREREEPERL